MGLVDADEVDEKLCGEVVAHVCGHGAGALVAPAVEAVARAAPRAGRGEAPARADGRVQQQEPERTPTTGTSLGQQTAIHQQGDSTVHGFLGHDGPGEVERRALDAVQQPVVEVPVDVSRRPRHPLDPVRMELPEVRLGQRRVR